MTHTRRHARQGWPRTPSWPTRVVAVVGTPHPDLGQQVTAYVVGDGVAETELIDFVARHLSAHKRPRQVRLVGALPRNAMGKVQKSRLTEV